MAPTILGSLIFNKTADVSKSLCALFPSSTPHISLKEICRAPCPQLQIAKKSSAAMEINNMYRNLVKVNI